MIISNRNAWSTVGAISSRMHDAEGRLTAPVELSEGALYLDTEGKAYPVRQDARPNMNTDALFFGLGRELGLPLAYRWTEQGAKAA